MYKELTKGLFAPYHMQEGAETNCCWSPNSLPDIETTFPVHYCPRKMRPKRVSNTYAIVESREEEKRAFSFLSLFPFCTASLPARNWKRTKERRRATQFSFLPLSFFGGKVRRPRADDGGGGGFFWREIGGRGANRAMSKGEEETIF